MHITASVYIKDDERHLLADCFQARQNGWPASLDGRRRKPVLVKIIGE